MSKFLCAVGAAMIGVAAPAAAQSTEPPQSIPNAHGANEPDVNKIICERQEEVGSRLKGKKVCLTVEQWKEFRAENREKTERLQQSAGSRPSG